MSENNIIEITNLSKKYKKRVILKKINLNIKKDSCHLLIGPNGSGKTTLIKCIINASNNFSGNIVVDKNKHDSKRNANKIGFVPENAKFPNISVYNFLYNMAYLSYLNKKKIKEELEKIIKKFNLEDVKKINCNKLSMGQKKKILLMQGLIHKPRILILDEPFSNLDLMFKNQLVKIISDYKNQGNTILIISHLLESFDNLVDDVSIIKDGNILLTKSIKSFLKGKNSTLANEYIKLMEGNHNNE